MSESAQPQQPPAGQQGSQVLKADDILKLQCLSDDEKQKFRQSMLSFWNLTQQHPPGSAEHTSARQKLTEWSQKLIYREKQYRQRVKQQMLQQQQQQQQAGAQGQAGPANQAVAQNQAQNQNQASVKQEQQQAQQQVPQQQQQQNPGQPRLPTSGPQASPDPAILKHVQEFPIQVSLNSGLTPGTPEYDQKIKEYRNGYLSMLVKQGQLVENRRKIVAQIEERQKQGQEPPQELLNMKARVEKEHNTMKERVENFRKMQRMWKEERDRSKQQAQVQEPQTQGPATNSQQPSAQPQPAAQPNMSVQPQVKDEPQIKIEGGQAPQAQQPNPQFAMQGNAQQPPQQLAQQIPQQQNVQMPTNLPQQQARPPPGAHSQSMPPGQVPQFAQQQAHMQQPNRPQINPHQANAHQQQQSNSPHPQSATTGQGPPVPLSHQAAVSAANRSYTNPQRTNTPLQQGVHQPGAQGTFGSGEREQLNNPKMPIPRHLNTTAPSPVHMGQARPTMSGPTNGAPGPMGQPVIPRPPPFQLEGEGDRVLSKRKLDELVRQVTGGSEDALTPEVEEAVMQLADDFVDNVISNACKLSKLRESSQLDIRDLQVVLERNYNIRIPGYASDEVRTVRKIVPAAGWVDKMKAVNAAKVMGGKADF